MSKQVILLYVPNSAPWADGVKKLCALRQLYDELCREREQMGFHIPNT